MSLLSQLKDASRLEVTKSFKLLNTNFSSSKWLSTTNIYNSNYVTETDPKINVSDYKEYLASSSILHLSDAWTYLSRAINASLNGDQFSARHLAYYAELRATMSLLASQGIGIHDKQHYMIHKNGCINQLKIHPKQSGTHTATWIILKSWSQTSSAKDLLENVISYEGKPIKEWVDNISLAPWNALAENIFKDWGMDLRILSRDHKIRNGASYNPNQLLTNTNVSACENIQFFSELWNLFNPSETSNFSLIDRELIRRSLLKVKDGMNHDDFKKKIEDFLNVYFSGTYKKDHILDYFTNDHTSSFFTMAEKSYNNAKDAIKDPENHLQIIARASLLLRLATGSSKKLISDAGRNFDDIHFWWNKIATNAGIWDDSTLYTSSTLNDLWLDIDDYVLQELDGKKCDNTVSLHSIKNDNELSKSLHLLSECERIMLWGLST